MDVASGTLVSEARIATVLPARRYLGQLCKHFQHKLPVTFDEGFTTGRIEFSAGSCELAVGGENELILRAAASDAEGRERVEGVVARHLERFAFRETLNIAWNPAV